MLQHDDVHFLCVYGYCSEERKRRSRHDNLILLSEFYCNLYRVLSSYSFSLLLCLPFLNAVERWSVFIHNSDLDENLRPTMSMVCGQQLCRCTNVHLALKQKYIYLLLVVVVVVVVLLLFHWWTLHRYRLRCNVSWVTIIDLYCKTM